MFGAWHIHLTARIAQKASCKCAYNITDVHLILVHYMQDYCLQYFHSTPLSTQPLAVVNSVATLPPSSTAVVYQVPILGITTPWHLCYSHHFVVERPWEGREETVAIGCLMSQCGWHHHQALGVKLNCNADFWPGYRDASCKDVISVGRRYGGLPRQEVVTMWRDGAEDMASSSRVWRQHQTAGTACSSAFQQGDRCAVLLHAL